MGRLDVRVCAARNLADTQWVSKPDPYAVVSLENQRHKTRSIDNSTAPVWDEVFKFQIADESSSQLRVELWNKNIMSDEFLGQYTISLSGLTKGLVKDGWYLLQQSKTNAELHVRLLAIDFGRDPTPAEQQQIGQAPVMAAAPNFQAPTQTSPMPQQGGYPPQQQQGYPQQQQGYPQQQQGYPQQGGYPPQQGGYPPQQQQGYPPQQQQGYPPQQQGGYPPQQGGYPPQQGGYPPQQGGYPPQQGGYPPQQGGYPPQQGGYPPQQGGYPPQQGGYPPQQGGYQQQGYGGPALQLIDAWYGTDAVHGDNNGNVDRLIRDMIQRNGRIELSGDLNNFFGFDPIFGQVKVCFMRVRYNGQEHQLRAQEGQYFSFP